MNRRKFIKASALVASSLAFKLGGLPLLAEESSGYKAIVLVNLEGGSDGNSILLPLETQAYSYYEQARGIAAVPQSSLIPLSTSSGSFGVHPSLAPLASLFSAGKLALVANVGNLTVPTNRSEYLSKTVQVPPNVNGHDGGQLMFQTANVAISDTRYGWGGMIADSFGSNSVVSPLISVGGDSVFGSGRTVTGLTFQSPQVPSLSGFDNSPASAARMAALKEILNTPTGSTFGDAANAVVVNAQAQSQALSEALNSVSALQTWFPNSPLGNQLRMVASIMQARSVLGVSRQIFYCTTGGFDLHSNIAPSASALLANLAQCLASFQEALVEIGVSQNVFTLTMSEFSRTLQLNKTGGADHAWGSHHIVMGDPIKGGQIYGTYPLLEIGGPDDAGSIGVWIPTTAVSQYVSPTAAFLGVDGSITSQVFPLLSNFPNGPVTYLR